MMPYSCVAIIPLDLEEIQGVIDLEICDVTIRHILILYHEEGLSSQFHMISSKFVRQEGISPRFEDLNASRKVFGSAA